MTERRDGEPWFRCYDLRNWKTPKHCRQCGIELNKNEDFFDICTHCHDDHEQQYDFTGKRRKFLPDDTDA